MGFYWIRLDYFGFFNSKIQLIFSTNLRKIYSCVQHQAVACYPAATMGSEHAEAGREERMRCNRGARNSAHWAAGPPSLSADDNQFHSLLLSSAVRLIWRISQILDKQVQADDLWLTALLASSERSTTDTKLSKYWWRCPIIAFRGTDIVYFFYFLGNPLGFVTHWLVHGIADNIYHVPERSNRQNWVVFATKKGSMSVAYGSHAYTTDYFQIRPKPHYFIQKMNVKYNCLLV